MAFWQKSGNRSVGPLRRYARSERGNISVLVALLIVPLVGILGMATEAGNWFAIQRSMQNAADSAVVAAANNATGVAIPANQTYIQEGRLVATKFGYTNNASTTVTVTYPDNTSIKCVNKCYAVTVQRNVPAYLTRIFGVGATQAVAAKAVAVAADVPTKYCLLSLGTGNIDGFLISGGHNVNLSGCNVRSNSDTTCNGSNSNGGANSITYGPSSNNKKCSPSLHATSVMADPYSTLPAPSQTCGGSYPGTVIGTVGNNTPLPWGSNPTPPHYCGDVTINGTVTVNTPSTGSLMVIENGNLIVNGQFITSAGSGLTVAFSGTNAGSHILAGGGDFNIQAPPAGSGTWSGVAVYQDPALTSGVDMSSAGNSPTWDISGLIYLPNSDISFHGTVNKSNNGFDCFVLVDRTFQSSGTGNILETQSQCAQQGVNLPTASSKRIALVY